MSIMLYLMGAINIIISIIFGVMTGGFVEFIISVLVGISIAVLLFGIGNIIDNQDMILNYLIEMKEENKIKGLKKCSSYNKEYDFSRKSCPYCGYKD